MKARTFSGTRFAGWFFLAQGVTIAAWWLYLFAQPAHRRYFLPAGASEPDLLAFLVPDLGIAVPASLAAGVTLLNPYRSSWSLAFSWAAAGAVDYAFFYCVAWSALRGGGWLSVAVMAPAALLSTVAALDAGAETLTIFRLARMIHERPSRKRAECVSSGDPER